MFNQFTGIGNLASEPELRFTKSGTSVASFTVCCDYGYGDNKKTEFVRCVAWDKLADIIGEYLRKGSKCFVQGSMQTRQWEDNDGNKRYSTEIVVNTMKMLDSKGNSSGSGGYGGNVNQDDDAPF